MHRWGEKSFMGVNNVIFMEVLEWFDQSGRELAHRLPEQGSGEIKFGAQAIIRDSQAAVFYSNGTACDALGPARHALNAGCLWRKMPGSVPIADIRCLSLDSAGCAGKTSLQAQNSALHAALRQVHRHHPEPVETATQ